MKNILIEALPYNPATSSITTVRMSGTWINDSSGATVNSLFWTPCLKDGPSLRVSNIFSNGQPQTPGFDFGNLTFLIKPAFSNTAWSTYSWDGAAIKVYVGDVGAPFASYTMILDGFGGPLSRDGQVATVPLQGADAALDVDLLKNSYAGTGTIEGDANLKGTLKPKCWGSCRNIEPVLINQALQIYQFHDGAANDVVMVYEGGNQINATAAATCADYTALVNASLSPGQWAKAPAIGMFRLGGQPSGKLTADVQGGKTVSGGTYVSTLGTIVPELLWIAGIGTAKIDATTFGSMTQTWGLYQREQVKVGEAVRAAFTGIGYLVPGRDGIYKCANFWNSRTPIALKADRSATPLVRSVKQSPATLPNWSVRVGHSRCWGVHSEGEISTAVKDAATAASTAQSSATAAQTAANNAQTAANTAQTTANNANTAAGTAQTTANNAQTAANNAQATANAGALRIVLSKPAYVVQAYNSGVVKSYTGANGQVTVYSGATDVTASATLSTTNSNVTGTVNTATNSPVNGQPKGYYEATLLSADNGTMTISATYGGYTVSATFTLSRGYTSLETVSALPATNLFDGRVVYLSTDSKLYRYSQASSTWTSGVDGTDLIANTVGSLALKVGMGNNMLAGVVGAVNPNTYMAAWNPDGIGYATTSVGVNGSNIFISPLFGTMWPSDTSPGFEKWTLTDNSTFCVYQPNGSTGATGYTALVIRQLANPVTGASPGEWDIIPGRSYEFSVYTGCHRCKADCYIEWYSGTVSGMGNTAGSAGGLGTNANNLTSNPPNGYEISNYTRIVARGTAPAGASKARVVIRKYHTTSGQTSSYLFMARPLFAETVAGAVEDIPWAPSPISVLSGDAVLAGSIAANRLSVAQLSAITANIGTLRTATSGQRVEISDNVIKVYDSSNVKRVQLGDLSA